MVPKCMHFYYYNKSRLTKIDIDTKKDIYIYFFGVRQILNIFIYEDKVILVFNFFFCLNKEINLWKK